MKVFAAGLLISFIGTLPFGVLNLTAFRLAHQHGIQQAVLFGTGATLVEVIYIRLTLSGNAWIFRQPWISKLTWVSIVVLACLTLSSFWNAVSPPTVYATTDSTMSSLAQGFMLSAVNPLQIPFWLGWNSVMMSKAILHPDHRSDRLYLIGAVTGTWTGLLLFAVGGWLAGDHVHVDQHGLHAVIGLIYLFCLTVQVIKLVSKKSTVTL